MSKDKVKLRFDFDKHDRLERKVSDVCERINDRVLPLVKALSVELTLPNLMAYARSSDNLKVEYIRQERAKMKVADEYLINWVTETATAKFEEVFNAQPYDDISISDEVEQVLTLSTSEGIISYDDGVLRELCTIYLKDSEREAYKRYLNAVKALNDFYNGKAPDGVNVGFHFPVVNGVVQRSNIINFEYFSK